MTTVINALPILADRKAKEWNRIHNHMSRRKIPKWKKRIGRLAGIPAYVLQFVIELIAGR